jgi:hypothetical protein
MISGRVGIYKSIISLCGASGGENKVELFIEVKKFAKIASPQAFIGE